MLNTTITASRRGFGLGLGCLVAGMLLGCGDSPENRAPSPDGSSGDGCPSTLPTSGGSCVKPANAMGTCDYFKEKSHCNYLDIFWRCSCDPSGWSCRDDKEDCPCPVAAPLSGSACAFPGPSSCGYPQGSAPTWSCTCDGKTWSCQGTAPVPGDGCPSTPPTGGGSCVKPANAMEGCDYFKEESRCNYMDIFWHCSCESSGWSCRDDKEDCPCPTAAPGAAGTEAFSTEPSNGDRP